MTLIYPAIFTLEDGCYTVEFPDLEGCLTYGDTLEEAFFNAKEALAGYSASVLERGLSLLKAADLEAVRSSASSDIVLLVDAKPLYTQAAVKKTLTIPSWLNRRAEEAHAPYSAILQKGLEKYLGLA